MISIKKLFAKSKVLPKTLQIMPKSCEILTHLCVFTGSFRVNWTRGPRLNMLTFFSGERQILMKKKAKILNVMTWMNI